MAIAFGQLDAGVLLGVEQVEEGSLFGVVGAGRIAGGRADAAVLFLDQVFAATAVLSRRSPNRRGPSCRHSAKASARRSARALTMIEL